MAQQHINIGTPNNEDGDFVRDAFSYAEDNFTELYARTYIAGNSVLSGGVVHIQNLEYYVWASAYIINNTYYNDLVSGTVILSDGDNIDPRIDLFTINSTTYAVGTVTLTGGTSGSVDSITINGVELLASPIGYLTSLNVTANLIVNSINQNTTGPNYFARKSGTVISIYAADGGTGPNGFVVISSATSITTADVNMAGGADVHSVGAVTGDPDVNPLKPDYNRDYSAEITFKLIQTGIVGDPDSTTVTIYDENAGIIGGEWDNTALPVGGNLTYTIAPFRNANCIDIPSTVGSSSTFLKFNAGTTLPNDDTPGNNIIFAIKTTSSWTTGGPNSSRLRVKIGSSGNTSTINFTANSIQAYGFQHTQVGTWQLVIVPIANYSHHFPTIEFLEFEFVNTPQLQLDWIIGQVGLVPPSFETTYLNLTDTVDDTYVGKNTFVPLVTGESGLTLTQLGAVAYDNDYNSLANLPTIVPPVENVYANTTALFADQINQTSGYLQEITDGSGFTSISSGRTFVKYKGTTVGDETDYTIIVYDASPFQALNEGSGIGFVIRGSNRAQASNVGSGALDFGTAYLDNTQGATGYQSFTLGEDCKATGFSSIAFGYDVESLDHYSFGSGAINSLQNRFEGAIGTGLIAKDYGTVVVGRANTDYAAGVGLNDANNRCFIVGTGDIAAGTPVTIGTRRDGFIVYNDGRVIAPEFSIAEIDAEATGKALVTKEWLNSKGLINRVEEDAAVTTTKNIDWGSYETFVYTMTGATTFSDTNLPAAGFSKTITLHMTGNFAPTYPAGWSTYITGVYDGTVLNIIVVEYVASTTPFYKVQITQPD